MATVKQLEAKQTELDIIKWHDSENDVDKCGAYDYCDKCDKSKDYPCARAYFAKNTTTSKSTSKATTAKTTAKKTTTTKKTTTAAK